MCNTIKGLLCRWIYMVLLLFYSQQDVWYWAVPTSLLYGGNVWLHQLQILWLPRVCARAGSAVASCKHARTNTQKHAVLCQVLIPPFYPQCVWIAQVVVECESLGRGPAEYGSGSQNETDGDRRDFAFHPICTHSLPPCIHGSISSFLSQLWSRDCINLAAVNRSRSQQIQKLGFSLMFSRHVVW